MTNLLGHFFERGADKRERCNKVGVAVALDNLAGDRSHAEAKLFTDEVLYLRRNGRVRTDRAGDFADGDLFKCCGQALLATAEFIDPEGQLQAKGHWLGMNAVCATRRQGIFVFDSLPGYRLEESRQGGSEQGA